MLRREVGVKQEAQDSIQPIANQSKRRKHESLSIKEGLWFGGAAEVIKTTVNSYELAKKYR
jgi:hypothetical protein